jgi:hypothetical protein
MYPRTHSISQKFRKDQHSIIIINASSVLLESSFIFHRETTSATARRSHENARAPCDALESIGEDPLAEEQLMALAADPAGPDVTCHRREAQGSDRDEKFVEATRQELQTPVSSGVWGGAPRHGVPSGAPLATAARALVRKRRIVPGGVRRWRARLRRVEAGQGRWLLG